MKRIVAVGLVAVTLAGCGMAKHPSTSAAAGTQPAGLKMIWNASMDLAVPKERDIEPTVEKARTLAEEMGGYASSESSGGVVLRVPNPRLREVIGELEKLGEVSDKHVNGDDVTPDYQDLEVRIENARKFQERLRELAAKSATVEELLEVEKEQARVTTELETLEARFRLLQSQTSLATVHLSVAKKIRPGPIGWVFVGAYRTVKWFFIWD
jgi:hypothetical protein